jgi:hypothetical protein
MGVARESGSGGHPILFRTVVVVGRRLVNDYNQVFEKRERKNKVENVRGRKGGKKNAE